VIYPTHYQRSKQTYTINKRGIALGMVFFVIVILIIIGNTLLTNTGNEIPAIKMIDKQIEARYMARSISEAIRLKIKDHPEEFTEALRDYENMNKGSGEISIKKPLNYETFISDFSEYEKLMENYGMGNRSLRGRLKGMKRIYIGEPEVQKNQEFVTDVIELDVEVVYTLFKSDFVKEKRDVKIELTERIKFKRRFKTD